MDIRQFAANSKCLDDAHGMDLLKPWKCVDFCEYISI